MNATLKKRAAAGVLGILTALALVLPAAAHHGGGHHGRRNFRQVPACTVEGCAIPGRHFHDGAVCCGTNHAGGACTAACYSQGINLKVPACEVEGCTLAGRHLHDGVTYCGAHHAGGFCLSGCYGAHGASGHHGC